MNWMLSDRAKALFPFVLLYLDATAHPDDPRSGLTVSRMKAHCANTGLCSPGSAAAFLALLQIRGFLEPAPMAADRRVRRLVPTARRPHRRGPEPRRSAHHRRCAGRNAHAMPG